MTSYAMHAQTHVGTLPAGTRGFDCNAPVTPAVAARFRAAGYRFAIRYLRRAAPNAFDLTSIEVATLLTAGLGLMAVQHVALPGWTASAALGRTYGNTAVLEARGLGLLPGTTVWLDLEEVDPACEAQAVIDYCNQWHTAVERAGFTPGLYVGVGAILGPVALYRRLRFRHYWAAYNLDLDARPATRGVQMTQWVMNRERRITGVPFRWQGDTIAVDALGGTPLLMLPGDPG